MSISTVVELLDGGISYKVPLPDNRWAFFYLAQSRLPLAGSRPAAKWIGNIDEDIGRDEDVY
jgi:hypothetical protein